MFDPSRMIRNLSNLSRNITDGYILPEDTPGREVGELLYWFRSLSLRGHPLNKSLLY